MRLFDAEESAQQGVSTEGNTAPQPAKSVMDSSSFGQRLEFENVKRKKPRFEGMV
jgi:hypothetical protein